MKRVATTKAGAALDVIAEELRGSMLPGSEFSGVLVPYGEGVEVEISIRVRHRVSLSQANRYREYAMVLWRQERAHDRCWHSVKNRSPWRSSSTTTCSGKVTTAVVHRLKTWFEEGPLLPGESRRLIEGQRYEFVCSHHADQSGPDVLAVVRLEKNVLAVARRKRRQQDDELQAREHVEARELEAEVRTLSDDALARRLNEFIASHQWGREDICERERRRRAKERNS